MRGGGVECTILGLDLNFAIALNSDPPVVPELSPCVHLEKHTNSTKNTFIVFKKKLNKPVPAFPPSLRLKEPQTKLTS